MGAGQTIRKATLIAITAVIASCSLSENPTSFSRFEDFYRTEAQCKSAVNSCYIPILDIYTSTFLIITDACTDLAFMGSTDQNAKFNVSPSNPQFGTTIWSEGYRGIMYCNAAIEGIKGSPVGDGVRLPLLADCVTMRAMYYYILTSTFGDVPFYTEAVTNIDVLDAVASLGRMDAAATRDYLINELESYLGYLPHKRACDVADNRTTAPFAYMLIAKLAMWNKDFETASEALLEIRSIYGNLDPGKYPLEDIMASHRNSDESIFEIQRAYSPTGIKKTTNIACICTPARTGDIYDGVQIPEMGALSTIWTCMSPTSYLSRTVFSNTADPRRDMTLAFQYNGVKFSRPASGGRPWLGPKFWNFGMIGVADGNNQKIFRFAEALLMLAECANEMGRTDLAVECYNEVRRRAGVSEMAWHSGYRSFLEELREEKARELFGEYGRKWDLVRWGIWYSETMDHAGAEYSNIRDNMKPCHEYYPIPDSEVMRSRGILTNDAYHRYGL